MVNSLPLHLSHVRKSSLIINRSHMLLHFIAWIALFYYRVTSLFETIKFSKETPILPYLLVFASETILCFLWVLLQAFRWRPISRVLFPERLPEEKKLPAIDVFICTADPNKEPTVEVMNTVISALALDYPPEKLFVYLSDDGGSSVTFQATREAYKFAKLWLPFCRTYGIKTRSPEAYFAAVQHDNGDLKSSEFLADEERLKRRYVEFVESIAKIREKEGNPTSRDHAAVIEVIDEKSIDAEGNQGQIPLLIYVSREKRRSHAHHFKAGALNVLLRVSGLISNSPHILVLDCDMYCNDSNSARQAMCFHLDPKISSSLALVQFPQRFHNISQNDIYDSQLRYVFKVYWPGMDGLLGPMISGTCFYLKKEALYQTYMAENADLMELEQTFGQSIEFLKSLGQRNKFNITRDAYSDPKTLHELQLVASCAYENETKWGKEVGFRYFSLLEDFFTSLNLHCNGWKSVYLDPPKPAFLGAGCTNLNDVLVQGTRWSGGLAEVAMSKFSPLIYGSSRMSIPQSMCYAVLAYDPFYFFPIWCLVTIPQLCLLNGIPLYPEVSNPFFVVFLLIFLSLQLKHVQEILSTGGSMQSWQNEQRTWLIRSTVCHLFGTLNAIMEKIGLKDASFLITNKVDDKEQLQRYQMGVYDFQAPTILLAPLCTLAILNMASLIGGVSRILYTGMWSELLAQVFLTFFVVYMSYPIIEGMFLRCDKGRVSPSVTLLSTLFAVVLMSLGSLILVIF